MFAQHSRKALFAALLATALSAPALANDSVATTQQTALAQMENDAGALPASPTQVKPAIVNKPSIVKESYATVNNGRPLGPTPATRARPAASVERPTAVSSVRQPSGGRDYYRAPAERSSPPLILGIRY
jgi:hypothetical protein